MHNFRATSVGRFVCTVKACPNLLCLIPLEPVESLSLNVHQLKKKISHRLSPKESISSCLWRDKIREQYTFSRYRKISWKSKCEVIAKIFLKKRNILKKICSTINQNYCNAHEKKYNIGTEI